MASSSPVVRLASPNASSTRESSLGLNGRRGRLPSTRRAMDKRPCSTSPSPSISRSPVDRSAMSPVATCASVSGVGLRCRSLRSSFPHRAHQPFGGRDPEHGIVFPVLTGPGPGGGEAGPEHQQRDDRNNRHWNAHQHENGFHGTHASTVADVSGEYARSPRGAAGGCSAAGSSVSAPTRTASKSNSPEKVFGNDSSGLDRKSTRLNSSHVK